MEHTVLAKAGGVPVLITVESRDGYDETDYIYNFVSNIDPRLART
jgi:hypothetical protein